MATMWTVDGTEVKANDCTSWMWARYNADGQRIYTPDGAMGRGREVPTAELLATWDAEAPVKVAEALAEARAKKQHGATAAETRKAQYPGTCKVTGRRYGAGARIRNTRYGWAIADQVTTDKLTGGDAEVLKDADRLQYQMSREDSWL